MYQIKESVNGGFEVYKKPERFLSANNFWLYVNTFENRDLALLYCEAKVKINHVTPNESPTLRK